MLEPGDRVSVGHLRIRSPTGDRRAAHEVAALLGAADLRPPGFPPSAILLIRYLHDPAPGVLQTGRSAAVPAAWQQTARDRVASLYRHAARPAASPVEGEAEAVVFADDGELLAAYSVDVVRGTAGRHWWWSAVLGPGPHPVDRLARQLVRASSGVPAMMLRLVDNRAATEVLRALSPAHARAVIEAVCRAFDVPELSQRLSAWAPMPSTPTAAGAAAWVSDDSPERPGSATAEAASAAPPDGRGAAPSPRTDAALGWEQHVLLEVGTALARSPALVRAPGFAGRVRRAWLSGDPADPRDHPSHSPLHPDGPRAPAAAGARPASPGPSVRRIDGLAGGRTQPRIALPIDLESAPTAQPGLTDAPEHGTAARVPPGGWVVVDAAAGGSDRSISDARAEASVAVRDPVPGAPQPLGATAATTAVERPVVEAADPARPDPMAIDQELGIPTNLGGVAYLINVMAHLDLPEAFEPDWRLASTVGAWGTLELLARGLLDEGPDVWDEDPLWPVLAVLDGRAGSLPAEGLEHAAGYRIPDAWPRLDRPDIGALRCATVADRVCLWSSHGYLLADQPLAGRDPVAVIAGVAADLRLPPTRVERVRPSRRPAGIRGGPLVGALSAPASAWLDAVLPFVRRRIGLALARSTLPPRSAAALLRRSARLHVTGTHVDTVLRLDGVTVAARLAGLDRDPGWQPAFGRVIKLHFL
jgi:hypothetical protein